MKKQKFSGKILKAEEEALSYILSVLQKRGTGYQIIDPATYDENFDDEVYELPRGINVTKHGFYEEFPIVVINIDTDNKLTFEGLAGLGDTDKDKIFQVDELSAPCICHIADIVAGLEV